MKLINTRISYCINGTLLNKKSSSGLLRQLNGKNGNSATGCGVGKFWPSKF
jgi:hypothetical protein